MRLGFYFAGVGLIEGLPGFDRIYDGLGFISQVLDFLKDCQDSIELMRLGFYFAGVGFIEGLPGFDRFYHDRSNGGLNL
jgi:hypothetical protein